MYMRPTKRIRTVCIHIVVSYCRSKKVRQKRWRLQRPKRILRYYSGREGKILSLFSSPHSPLDFETVDWMMILYPRNTFAKVRTISVAALSVTIPSLAVRKDPDSLCYCWQVFLLSPRFLHQAVPKQQQKNHCKKINSCCSF